MRSLRPTLALLVLLALGASASANETTFTISGQLGLPGVTMQGLPGAPLTDENGCYSARVPNGWSGTVRPVKKGYSFTPPMLRYDDVTQDCVYNDYRASIRMYTISGATSLAGVVMHGLPGNPVTDAEGHYQARVEYGWSGTVKPEKEGHQFGPPYLVYESVTHDCPNQNYVAQVLTFTISGNVGLDGVTMTGLPGRVVTDSEGKYSSQVAYGWSGTVKPEKGGCKFAPISRQYVKVATDQRNEDYEPVEVAVAPTPYAASAIDVLVIPTSQVDPKAMAEIREDMQVMVHILRDMLSEPRMILGILYDYGDIFGRSDRGTQAFYIQGYGALFVMQVDFPFSFPAAAEPGDESEEPVDPVWQRARQRLRSPGARRPYGQGTEEKMSFEQFQNDLIATLKHAANIRHIDPNETVILTLIGQDAGEAWSDFDATRGAFARRGDGGFSGGSYSVSGSSFGPDGGTTYANTYSYSNSAGTAGSQTPARNTNGNMKRDALGNVVYQKPSSPTIATVLTIQARKADVDAFSAGQIDREQFQQRVKVFTY